jgi:26S proteasome regulatory subunit N2
LGVVCGRTIPNYTAKCIDEYIEQRVAAAEAKEEADIDERLVAIVERMFERCMADKQHRQAIGIALESRRIDRLEQSILQSEDVMGTLQYTLNASLKLVTSREFRTQVRRAARSPATGPGEPAPAAPTK